MHNSTSILLATLTLCLATAAGAAPKQVVPGSALVDGSNLKAYDNVWRYTIHRADGTIRPQALWTDHLQKVHRGNRDLLYRVQGVVYVNGAITSQVNVFDPASLSPVSDQTRAPNGDVLKRKFHGKHVISIRTTAGKIGEKRTEIDLKQAPFDFFGGMYGLLISCLPMKPGATFSLPSIDEFEDKPRTVTVRIGKKEWVQAGRMGRVRAWVATTRLPEYDMKFWVTKSPPYVIRLDMHLNKKNVDATFEMI